MSDLLLPCPFCGQKAYIRKRHHSMPRDPTYQAYCDDCGCGTSDLYRQPALAIQAWNQRARAENERLTERCAAYKGQVQAGSVRIEAAEKRITELEGERDTATRALRYFMEDPRFQVGVGGNPIAVDRMLAEVRAILAALSKTEGKG